MEQFIEKLIGRLEEEAEWHERRWHDGTSNHALQEHKAFVKAIKIVKELAEEYKPKTQADKIWSMTDEELAEFLEGVNRDYDISYGEYFSNKAGDFIFSKKDLAKEILKWLQSEA